MDHDSSFVAMFVKNQRRIHAYILTIVPDYNEAADLFQQTSMLLWERAQEFPSDGDFVRWACRVALNVVRNYRVKKRRDRHWFSDEMIARIAEVHSQKSEWLDEALVALGACMEDLDPSERRLFGLCYQGDRSIRAVCEELGRTEASVYQRLHRIRVRLLECIQRKTRKEAPR
jgi:RNA polymerase sigma-70 factor, ECF subfamily